MVLISVLWHFYESYQEKHSYDNQTADKIRGDQHLSLIHICLPENILPLCVIPFGYPATKENPKQKFDDYDLGMDYARLNGKPVMPVSYTHLDVYKRQSYHRSDYRSYASLDTIRKNAKERRSEP